MLPNRVGIIAAASSGRGFPIHAWTSAALGSPSAGADPARAAPPRPETLPHLPLPHPADHRARRDDAGEERDDGAGERPQHEPEHGDEEEQGQGGNALLDRVEVPHPLPHRRGPDRARDHRQAEQDAKADLRDAKRD